MANLIVTNGSSAVSAIERIRPGDRFLTWDDVLHDGPVPAELSLKQLSAIRSRFLWRCGWGSLDEITRRFEDRNHQLLTAHENYDELILWFEHDLYDQLQLIQILTTLNESRAMRKSRLPISLICEDHFVGMSGTEILSRDFRDRQFVTPEQISLASTAWEAFTYFTPQRLESFIQSSNLTTLPYLRSSLKRWFAEFPDVQDGLTQTERLVLTSLSKGVCNAKDLFVSVQNEENAPFLGDGSFWRILHKMSNIPAYLIRTVDESYYDPLEGSSATFELTEYGEQTLSGIVVESRRLIDRWMGGVHLRPGNCWYWNPYDESFQNDLLGG